MRGIEDVKIRVHFYLLTLLIFLTSLLLVHHDVTLIFLKIKIFRRVAILQYQQLCIVLLFSILNIGVGSALGSEERGGRIPII